MKFLFAAIASSGRDQFIYRVYETGENTYFAGFMDKEGAGWHFRKIEGEWMADDPDLQHQAEQLGEEVERKSLP